MDLDSKKNISTVLHMAHHSGSQQPPDRMQQKAPGGPRVHRGAPTQVGKQLPTMAKHSQPFIKTFSKVVPARTAAGAPPSGTPPIPHAARPPAMQQKQQPIAGPPVYRPHLSNKAQPKMVSTTPGLKSLPAASGREVQLKGLSSRTNTWPPPMILPSRALQPAIGGKTGRVLQRASTAIGASATVDIDPLVRWLKANDPGKQKSNFSVGLTTSGALIISKVGGLTSGSDIVAALTVYLQGNYAGHTVYLAKKFNSNFTSGNHAEMCVVAAARALGLTLSKVTCTHPNCRYCSAMMTHLGIGHGSITSGEPDNQGTWAHAIANAAFGTQYGHGEDTAVGDLKRFNNSGYSSSDLTGGKFYGGTVTGGSEQIL